jgi:uncharacterized protein with HEPN domain
MYDSVLKEISFVKGISFKTFNIDDKTQYAVIRAIEIIGEAGKKSLIIYEGNIRIFPGGKSAE